MDDSGIDSDTTKRRTTMTEENERVTIFYINIYLCGQITFNGKRFSIIDIFEIPIIKILVNFTVYIGGP